MGNEEIRQSLRERNDAVFKELGFHDFLDRANGRPEQFVLHGAPLQPGLALAGLYADLGQYHFLPAPPAPRFYPAHPAARYLTSKALRTRYAGRLLAAMAYAWLRAIGSRKRRRALA